jgi:hypothetical protein
MALSVHIVLRKPMQGQRIKVEYEGDMKIFTIKEDTFAKLIERIKSSVGVPPDCGCELRWVDADNDEITITSHEEFCESFRSGVRKFRLVVLSCYVNPAPPTGPVAPKLGPEREPQAPGQPGILGNPIPDVDTQAKMHHAAIRDEVEKSPIVPITEPKQPPGVVSNPPQVAQKNAILTHGSGEDTKQEHGNQSQSDLKQPIVANATAKSEGTKPDTTALPKPSAAQNSEQNSIPKQPLDKDKMYDC